MTYDTTPTISAGADSLCAAGAEEICQWIAANEHGPILVETYPGVVFEDIARLLAPLRPSRIINTSELFLPTSEVERLTGADLASDPVFGQLTRRTLGDFLDPRALHAAVEEIAGSDERIVVIGPGAHRCSATGLLIYADLSRREATLRQRHGTVCNLGLNNETASSAAKYQRSYFIDWRVADREKKSLWPRISAFLDTTHPERPLLLPSHHLYAALEQVARRPFRVVPWFDPAPWGGTWMERVCAPEHDASDPNLGWCFDCVPEENSLLLSYGRHQFEIPSLDLVFREPKALLGESVYGLFGDEFPIRTDFLDTMDGGNLSLQVHPLAGYMREQFGHAYTQDESYYIMDAKPGATVHLGLRDGLDRKGFIESLRQAQSTSIPLKHEEYVNVFPTKRHDHFLIPSGTVHGSGANTMVLEISSTPYIFTFKLYDWLRPDLNGELRPINIDRGIANIVWERTTVFCQRELINAITPTASGDGWREERTGLHQAEFIETRRHWFTRPVQHRANGRFAVGNLVEGHEAMIESPDGSFDPFPIHYAETFIVPAAAGDFIIRPVGEAAEAEHATIKAFIRTSA